MEGAFRWRDEKSIPHVDLCRPFAAHWYAFILFVLATHYNAYINNSVHLSLWCSIGYPVVTLGFGVKSYVSYRIRHRKQREVAKENDFFMQLLKLALPNDDPANDELLAQIRQPSELLHSATLGEIDLPVSSAIIGKERRPLRVEKEINEKHFNKSFYSPTYPTTTTPTRVKCTSSNTNWNS